MIQVVPAQCRLQRKHHGIAGLGYRVLNLDGTLFSPFTQRGVVVIAPGYYTVLGGVPAPVAGGTIIWGQSDHDILPWPIDPMPVTVDNSEQLTGIVQAMTELAQRQPAKPDKTGYSLDRATLAAVREMFGQALEQYNATEIHAVAERIIGQFAELAAAHDESARIVAGAAVGLRQMTERVGAETREIVETQDSRFDEATTQLCATVAEIAARPVVPHEDMASLRAALSEFVEATLSVQPNEELIYLRQAVAEFVEAAETEPDPQQYAEDEAAAMLEAAVRVLAREDE